MCKVEEIKEFYEEHNLDTKERLFSCDWIKEVQSNSSDEDIVQREEVQAKVSKLRRPGSNQNTGNKPASSHSLSGWDPSWSKNR